MEDKEQLLTYNSQKVINIKEIQQGDIFRNIPFYSPDFLLKSTINKINVKIKNEAEIIFDEIIQNKCTIIFIKEKMNRGGSKPLKHIYLCLA